MHFIVHYLDSRGDSASVRVEAPTKEEARWASKIPERRIVRVKDDYLGQLSTLLEPPGPDIKNQAIFLQALSSSISTGKTVHQAIDRQSQHSGWLRAKKNKLDECETLADYLKAFRFDRFAILLSKTAEKTGRYSEALRQSSQYLIAREKVNTEVHSEFRTGITYIILGLLFLIVVPLFVGSTLEEIQKNKSLKLDINEFTEFLLFFGAFLKTSWPFILGAIALFILYFRYFWTVLKRFPYLRLFHLKTLLSRGLQFLSAYKMLHEAGCVDKEIILELLQSSSGSDRTVYQRMYAHLAKSEDLQSAFHEDDWGLTVRDGMSIISDVDKDQQHEMLVAMLETSQMESVHVTRQISRGLSRIGFLLMIFSVLSAVFGFYIPIVSAVSTSL